MTVDTLAIHAREALNLPAEWVAFKYETLDRQAFRITGCIPSVYKSGPRKGKPKYGKEGEQVFICSIAEHRAWESAWCERENKCNKCFGEGELWTGWSKAEGRRTKPCPVCTGTGVRS